MEDNRINQLVDVEDKLDGRQFYFDFLEEDCIEEEEMELDDTVVVNPNALNNSNVIRNISTDQKEILYNIMTLYNNGNGFDCDMTSSSMKFYTVKKSDKYIIPEPPILFDVYPQDERIKKITPFNKLPLEDGAIHSIVCDLPFVISPKTCPSMFNKKEGSCIIANRFSSWYPYMEGYENMYWWIKECARVIDSNGIIVWKMQNTISGGLSHWFTMFCALCAQNEGLYMIDEFILEAKSRLISSAKIKKQQHARKYTSSFLVFKKDTTKAKKSNCIEILNDCIKNVYEGKEWEVK